MAVYLMLTTLTDEGRKAIEEDPERVKDMNKEIEYMGAKIVAQYALLGQYDFVNIIEASGDADAAKFAIHISGRGTMQTMTFPAIPVDELITILKKK
ncbi:MAG: GYD domain-containing protein, partial [Chloroflexota bacterium]